MFSRRLIVDSPRSLVSFLIVSLSFLILSNIWKLNMRSMFPLSKPFTCLLEQFTFCREEILINFINVNYLH